MDRVPSEWREDRRWRSPAGGGGGGLAASYKAAYPSRWLPVDTGADLDQCIGSSSCPIRALPAGTLQNLTSAAGCGDAWMPAVLECSDCRRLLTTYLQATMRTWGARALTAPP